MNLPLAAGGREEASPSGQVSRFCVSLLHWGCWELKLTEVTGGTGCQLVGNRVVGDTLYRVIVSER